MRSIEIENIKGLTSQLFAGNIFDGFLAVQASFTTVCTYEIDGHINSDFVGEEDMKLPENAEGIVYWKKLRPICFEIIKGKKVPRQFLIVLMYPAHLTENFLKSAGITDSGNNISGLFININFRQGRLYCTTGCSLKTFSLDRRIETAWDEYVESFLKKLS